MLQSRFEEIATDYPEIVARMMWHQAHQGREMTYGPNIDDRGYGRGFSWQRTPEGVSFWKIIMNGGVVDEDVVPFFEQGDTITLKYKDKCKNFVFIDWDLEHKAVWVMTPNAWLMFNSREASDNTRQDLRKMPIPNIIW